MTFEKQRTLQELRHLARVYAMASEAVVEAQPAGFRLKPMRSRWGSCNAAGVIALNSRLMYLPERLVAYVVHHEMLHLKIKNHGRDFRRHMDSQFPDRIDLDKMLRSYGSILRQ